MGDGAVTEKDGECDPISAYLKNRVVIPLHLQHTYAHFPIRHNRRRAEMESRAQSECEWTEEGLSDGFHVATAHFLSQSWGISYQVEEESQCLIRRRWSREHPEYKRTDEGRMPTIMEVDEPTEDDSTDGSVYSTIRAPHVDLVPVSMCYNEQILYKFIVQRYLKEVTNLPCIPEILAHHAWVGFGPEIINGVSEKHTTEELSWILEESMRGAKVKVEHDAQGMGTDKISYRGPKDTWIRLSGRAKERFLDDLARIQIAYSFITFPQVGTLSLEQCPLDTETRMPILQLDDRVGSVTVDIRSSTSEESLASAGAETDAIPGPYPLQPIFPIWENILINPDSGNILQLRNSFLARTVPWEVAAQPPLQLSSTAREKYVHSLKRHWFGYYIRIREDGGHGLSLPRLDQLASQME